MTLSADSLNVAKWWIDGSFVTHPNMRGHTGITMSLGKGSVFSTSVKQKLNTKSSTETELISVDDAMPYVLWTQYFLECQGYNVERAKLYQDNMSAMFLEQNGKWSSGKKTKHINVRFFFIKDRVEKGEVEIEHCGTNNMVANFLRSPYKGQCLKNLGRRS
eukprot:15339862-Ditylum_brightwellii.AAC.1